MTRPLNEFTHLRRLYEDMDPQPSLITSDNSQNGNPSSLDVLFFPGIVTGYNYLARIRYFLQAPTIPQISNLASKSASILSSSPGWGNVLTLFLIPGFEGHGKSRARDVNSYLLKSVNFFKKTLRERKPTIVFWNASCNPPQGTL